MTSSMVMVILLSLIFSNIYTNSLIEKIAEKNKASVSKMNIGFENLNKEMDQLYLLLRMDMNVYTFLNQLTPDDVKRGQAIITADKFYQINPYVNSIALYNKKIDDYILLGDQDFEPLKTIEKMDTLLNNLTGIKNFISSEIESNSNVQQTPKHLLSLVYSERGQNTNDFENMVIINLDWDKVQEGILEKDSGITFIWDKTGSSLAYYGDNMALSPKSTNMYYDYIINSNKSLDSIKRLTENKQELITYIKNNDRGWIIVNIKSYEDVLNDLHNARNVIILIACIVMLIGLILGYLISKYLYAPIRNITEMVQHSKYATGVNLKGELSLISDAYQGAIKDIINLEQKNESTKQLLKEDFIRGVLTGIPIEDLTEEKTETIQLDIGCNDLFIVVLKIDYPNQIHELSKSTYENAVMECTKKVIENDYNIEIIHMFDGIYGLLLSAKDKNNQLTKLVLVLEDVKSFIDGMQGGYVAIGIGGLAKELAECKRVYDNALEMIKYRFVLGYDVVIYQRYIEEHLTNSLNYPDEIERKLIAGIISNNREEFYKYLENFISILKNYMYQDAVIIFLQVTLECIRAMNKSTSANRLLKIDFDDFSLIFGKLQTLSQAKEWLLNIFDEYQKLLKEFDSKKDNKHYEIIEVIKLYVQDNYTDSNLSVDQLAEKAGYSTNYFAKVFKHITGQYITDYIKQLRIAKAKELLTSSHHSINEISNMVGFINSTYFYSAFKKDVGLTPSTYRNYKK